MGMRLTDVEFLEQDKEILEDVVSLPEETLIDGRSEADWEEMLPCEYNPDGSLRITW